MSSTSLPASAPAPAARARTSASRSASSLILCLFFLPVPAIDDRLRAGAFDRAVGADPDGRAVDPEAARILRLPDRAAGRDGAAARAQHLDDAADPRRTAPRAIDRGRLHHRRLRPAGDGRRLRHRHHRLPHPGHHQLPGHHQGRDAHRRSRRALHPRRHSRQADGDRRRPVRRPDRREGRRSSAAASSKRRAPSSARWTARRNSCAATPSPA